MVNYRTKNNTSVVYLLSSITDKRNSIILNAHIVLSNLLFLIIFFSLFVRLRLDFICFIIYIFIFICVYTYSNRFKPKKKASFISPLLNKYLRCNIIINFWWLCGQNNRKVKCLSIKRFENLIAKCVVYV